MAACALLLCMVLAPANGKDNGLALVPPLTWNSWYALECDRLNEVRRMAPMDSVSMARLCGPGERRIHGGVGEEEDTTDDISYSSQGAVRANADVLAAPILADGSSLVDRGYRTMVLDDCWMAMERDSDGNLQPGASCVYVEALAAHRRLHRPGEVPVWDGISAQVFE